ncbi:MAG: hypothetical protein AAF968_26795 [Pseudomonadota bacterium]
MILGRIEITNGSVETHRNTYNITDLRVVSVRRTFLPLGLLGALGLCGFALRFGDLLYPGEAIVLLSAGAAMLGAGLLIGQIQFLSRELKGTEFAGVVYGTYGHLNRLRREIVRAMHQQSGGPSS